MRQELSLVPTLTRREFFRIGMTSFAGFHLLPMVTPLPAKAAEKIRPRGSAEFCIFLFLAGGPSQLDTFDVKEGRWTPPDFDIRTVTSDIQMPFGLFPRLSQRINHLLLARSVEAWESIHERGQYYVQVGHAFSGARVNEIPSVGSIVAYEFQSRRKETDFLPPFVAMNVSASTLVGCGMLPSTYAPLPLTVSADGDLAFVVADQERDTFNRRWEFLQRMDRAMRTGSSMERGIQDYNNYYLGAYEMMKRPE